MKDKVMKKLFFSVALAFAGLSTSASAQLVLQGETNEYYGEARGWSVHAIRGYDGAASCRAHRGNGYDQEILFEAGTALHLLVPSNLYDRWAGAAMWIDGRAYDRQVGLDAGYARMELDWDTRQALMKGNTLKLQIVGEYARTYSLRGSTAAILKAEECWKSGFGRHAATNGHKQQQGHVTAPVHVDGWNIGYASHSRGVFRQRTDGSWVEEGDDGSRFFFLETGRDRDNVYLDDPTRDLQIAINAAQGVIYWAQAGGPWQVLYRTHDLNVYVSDRAG